MNRTQRDNQSDCLWILGLHLHGNLQMIRESDLYDHIRTFASTISHQQLGLALYRPEKDGQPTRCFANVDRKVEVDGGRAQLGWMFHHRYVVDIAESDYLVAVHHSVWNAPNGDLVDVTPFHSEMRHRPISPGGDVLFLVDDKALPFTTDRFIAPLPLKFHPINNSGRLLRHLQRLKRKEEEQCRLIYEGKTPEMLTE